jgi:hypothetical protein
MPFESLIDVHVRRFEVFPHGEARQQTFPWVVPLGTTLPKS